MELELEPEQPEEVVRAVAELLGESAAASDPWWQAGLDEALDGRRASALQDDATAPPRRTRGAERA